MKKLKVHFTPIALAALLVFTGCHEQELEPNEPGLLVPRTVDQDASLPQLAINGTTLHAETFGDPGDPMIVVLHGGPGGDYRSMLNCKEFSNEGYFVVFYDQRGSGLSKRHPKQHYTIEVMIEDLDAIIAHYRQHPEQKVFLLGHSWGGMLASAYIDRHPTTVDGAILAEPGGLTWTDTRDYIARTRKSNPAYEEASDVFYFHQFITGKEGEHEILDYKFALTTAHDHAKGNAIGSAGPTPFWRKGAAANAGLLEIGETDGFNFTQNLGNFTSSVLFLYSELNTAYGLAHAQRVSSAYPKVQLAEVKGTGHEIPYFGWEHFFGLTLEYLNANK